MKRILAIVFALVISLGVCGCSNNNANENDKPINTCEHTFSEKVFSYTLKKVEEKEEIFTEQKCTLCGEQKKVSGIIVSNQMQVGDALRGAKKGDVIYFKKVKYLEINVLNAIDGVTLFAENGASVEKITFRAEAGCKNIVIDGFKLTSYDLGGILFHQPVDTITVRNCSFEGCVQLADYETVSPLIKNLVVEKCRFFGIYRSEAAKITAIRVRNLDGFTLLDSEFDIIQYNAVQVGGGQDGNALTGEVLVSGCSFRETGSRVLYFVYNRTQSCVVENNLFYSNEDCESSGRYVHQREGRLTVKVNTWENIPDASEQNFSGYDIGLVEYDKSIQLTLEEK